ncbi:uromodulin-like [Astyanax mexicanus]|uniref:uromodulin-like n=1 Tax=Astyanax mexicanus TaxID=7994 RepID=UPI0020CAAB55|nr:uromodulin-like [Astyanax mexicanus]
MPVSSTTTTTTTDPSSTKPTTTPINTANITSDPCSVYRNFSSNGRNPIPYYSYRGVYDDTLVEWNGWYRLYLQGSSAQIPELHWCSSYMACGGYAALLLDGPHPLPEDGIVTRDIYGFYPDTSDSKQCIKNSRSNPIQVKACPGNYYVYRLVKPTVSLPMPTYCAVVVDTPSYDPCSNYTSLDQSWRGTNETEGSNCDRSTNWNGWYRLLYKGMSTQMPESCVNVSRCGTNVPLWLSGSHPQISDGIVTRGICGNYGSDCCYYRSFPIRVKACPGNYYVYEFVKTSFCTAAYCAGGRLRCPPRKESPVARCEDHHASLFYYYYYYYYYYYRPQ